MLVDSPPSELLAHHPRREAAGRDRTAQAHGRSAEPLCAIIHMAVGRALMHHGELEEASVLGLRPTRLSNQEIGRKLYVSVNTVKSQVRAIYRKLGVTSRAEAVTRARHLRLLPGSTPTDRRPSHPDEPQAR